MSYRRRDSHRVILVCDNCGKEHEVAAAETIEEANAIIMEDKKCTWVTGVRDYRPVHLCGNRCIVDSVKNKPRMS